MSPFGQGCVGFTLSVSEVGELGSFVSLRSSARLELASPLLDLAAPGPNLPLRSFVRLGLSLLIFSRVELDFSMLLLDHQLPGSFLLLHSFARSGSVLLVLDLLRLELPLFLKGMS